MQNERRGLGKLFALFLIMLLVVGMLPAAAFAQEELQVIDRVTLEGIVLGLEAGKVPGSITLTGDENYTITSQRIQRVGSTDKVTDALEAGVHYELSIQLCAKDGYRFDPDSQVTVRGVNWLKIYGGYVSGSDDSSTKDAKTFFDFIGEFVVEEPGVEKYQVEYCAGIYKAFVAWDVEENTQYTVVGNDELFGGTAPDGTEYEFVNWNTEKDGSGITYNPGDTFLMPSHHVALWAQWKLKEREPIGTVTLDGSSMVPVAGEAPKFLHIAEDAPYTIASQRWLLNGQVTDTDATTLEAGETYFYCLRLTAKDPYEFSDDADLLVMGIDWPTEEEADKVADNVWLRHGVTNDWGEKQLEFAWVYTVPKATEPAPEDPKPIEYEILNGKEQTIEEGEQATFRSDAEFSKFVEVRLDNEVVAPANYTVREGSTIVTLKADFLKNLSVGKHRISIVSTDGKASTYFTIIARSDEESEDDADPVETNKTENKNSTESAMISPKTGDSGKEMAWSMLLFCIFGAAMGIVGMKKKSEI